MANQKTGMKKQEILITSVMLSVFLLGGCIPSGTPLPSATTPFESPVTPGPLSPAVSMVVSDLQGLTIEQFFEEAYQRLVIRDPDLVIYFINESYAELLQGPFAKYNLSNDRFTDISDAYLRETQQLERAILDLLHSYQRSALTYDQQVAYDTLEWYLETRVEGHPYSYYSYPVNSEFTWGMSQDTLMIMLMDSIPINTPDDAEDYLGRLSEMDTWVDQLLEGLRLRERAGIIPTQFMIRRTLAQIERGYSEDIRDNFDDPEENHLFTSFVERLELAQQIGEEDKQAFRIRALSEMEQTVIPALAELKEYMTYLLSIAPQETGAWNLPNGQDYYAYKLRSATSSDMTADEIHQLGLREVERLTQEIQEFAHQELGYPRNISMYELYKRMGKEVGQIEVMDTLSLYQGLLDGVEAKYEQYFNIHPKAAFEIKLSYPGIVYNDPSYFESGFNIIRFNYRIDMPRYTLDTWFYHEITPGHLFSRQLLYELDLPAPTFQRSVLLPSYLEGWALYVEQLTWEMGLYDGAPYSNLGRLLAQLLRAARLVVETGIHTKEWTMDEAAYYMSSTTGRPTPPGEMIRYIVEPGQGCSYYIGYLKILELRQRARTSLGEAFDIRQFHDLLLKYGQMPLGVMERVVNDWIDAKMSE